MIRSTVPKADTSEHEEKLAKRNAKSVQQSLLEINSKIGQLTDNYKAQQTALAAALERIQALEIQLQYAFLKQHGSGPTVNGSYN